MRPLIVFSLISVLLLTFYIREGEAGPIHAVRSGVTTITSPAVSYTHLTLPTT